MWARGINHLALTTYDVAHYTASLHCELPFPDAAFSTPFVDLVR